MTKKYLSQPRDFSLLFLCVCLVSFLPKQKPTLFMIGDSTMSVKSPEAFPENGWGMALVTQVLADVPVQNYARNGRSTKSFIQEGLWKKVFEQIQEGDYVIIQFGHNDEKANDSTRYTLPETTYKENLRLFINDTRSKGGIPVLCTPVVRRKFGKDGKIENTHGDYPKAMRELALEMKVALIDLTALTEATINELGPEGSKSVYMLLTAGEHPNFPQGKDDNTHLKDTGAALVASLFVKEVKRQQLPLAVFLK